MDDLMAVKGSEEATHAVVLKVITQLNGVQGSNMLQCVRVLDNASRYYDHYIVTVKNNCMDIFYDEFHVLSLFL